MILSTKGFFFPWMTTGQMIYDAAMLCHTLGFVTYCEVENANYRDGAYLLSTTDQHYLMVSGYMEEYYTDPVENWGDKTVAEQLRSLAPRQEVLYEFNLILTDADPDTGPPRIKTYVAAMTKACSVLFDMADDGTKVDLAITARDA